MRGKYDLLIRSNGKLEVLLAQRIRKAVVAKIEELTDATWNARGERFEGHHSDAGVIKEILTEEYPDWTVLERDERPRFRHRSDRIAWSDIRSEGLGGGWVGFVKGRRIFRTHCSYSYKNGNIWYLYTELPGFEVRLDSGRGGWAASGASREKMQDRAEEILAEHVERLGATFSD